MYRPVKDNSTNEGEIGRTYSLRGEMRNSNKIVVIKLKGKNS
jgi:hypothetical protein